MTPQELALEEIIKNNLQKKFKQVYSESTAVLRQKMGISKATAANVDPQTPKIIAGIFTDAAITVETSHYRRAFKVGSKSAQMVLGSSWTGVVDQSAVDVAIKGRQEWLSTTIDATHAPAIQDIIASGIEDGSSYKEMAQQLADELGIDDGSLAEMIAQTESQWSVNEARYLDYSRLGFEQVEIDPAPDACEECMSAADDNPYSIDEGEGLLPIHPRCRCALVPVFAGLE